MAYETLLVERREDLGIISLNRPERLNALNLTLVAELNEALTEFEEEDKIKVIIITGTGDKAFSAGADIHEMAVQDEAALRERGSKSVDQNWHLATCRKPTIGAINGLAYGGGALLSTLLDIRIGCQHSSFRFLGVSYGRINSTWTLPLIVGSPMARELLFTGRVVAAEEALRIGLLNKLVPSSELIKAAVHMGQSIATHDGAVVQRIKEILSANIGLGWRDMMLNEIQTVSQSLKVPPPGEAFRDFLERRSK